MPGRNIAEILAGLVVVVVAAAFLVFAIVGTGADSGAGYNLYARFIQVNGLSVGAPVEIAGVKVGNVAALTINPETYLATVTMVIHSDVKIPVDSSAVIESSSLLGGNFLALIPGASASFLAPGGYILSTKGAVSLQEILGKFIFSATSMVENLKKNTASPAAQS